MTTNERTMTRAEYEAKRRELRKLLHTSCPPEEVKWRQPLALAHWADLISETLTALDRLNGTLNQQPRQTKRQFLIEYHAKGQAKRNAHRAALKALRAAGADEGDIRRADNNIRFYGAKPEHYLHRAAELMEMRA